MYTGIGEVCFVQLNEAGFEAITWISGSLIRLNGTVTEICLKDLLYVN